jgi:hypothetical protein
MNAAIEDENATSPLDICTVVVIYDDIAARTRAMKAGDYLVKQFWENVELKFHWWRTDFLRDNNLAQVAARNAIAADFLIVCVGDNETASALLEAWFETWITRRTGREGALLDLSSDSPQGGFLRELCTRGRFDYLAPAPVETRSPRTTKAQGMSIPAATEARHRDSRPPSRFGLNE